MRISLILLAVVLLVVAVIVVYRGFKKGGRLRYSALCQALLPLTGVAVCLAQAGMAPKLMFCIATASSVPSFALLIMALLHDWYAGWDPAVEAGFVRGAQAFLVLATLVAFSFTAHMDRWLQAGMAVVGACVGMMLLQMWRLGAKKLAQA